MLRKVVLFIMSLTTSIVLFLFGVIAWGAYHDILAILVFGTALSVALYGGFMMEES